MKKILLFLVVAFLLGCSPNHNLAGGTTDETLSGNPLAKGLYGKLVDIGGKAVFGARVKAVNIANGWQKPNETTSFSVSETDSVSTDSLGYYSFQSLNAGIYNLQGDYGNGKLVCLIKNIYYDSAGMVKQVKTDTLRAPGQISGIVNTHTEDDGGVLCYIPGTSYLAMTDDTGGFILSNIPQGTYKVTLRKEGLKTISDTAVAVHAGDRTTLPIINMEADPAYPPPVPAGLSVVYDTLHGRAILTWKPVVVSDLAGYVIYRNDSSSSIPLRINDHLFNGTCYTDTVFFNLMDTVDRVLTYRIKAQDSGSNLSTVYSKAFSVGAPSPTKVRTFIAWKFLNTLGDSASIGDTVSVVSSFKNATRKNDSLRWFIDGKDSAVRTTAVSSLSGSDTLQWAWHDTSKKKILIAISDQGATTWRDSTSIKVVQDVPVAEAGKDTTVIINTAVSFTGTAVQRFGTIMIYKWDFDGDGFYDDSSKATGTMTHTYTHEAIYTAVIFVRDDDRNEATDSIKVTVKNSAPTITSIRQDTTISINDSITFFGAATDTDGTIKEYAWDFTDDGTFEYVSSTQISTGFRYTKVGLYHAVLLVKDDYGKVTYDTATIGVSQDVPVTDAGKDKVVAINTAVPFTGTATQRFGTIVMYKWDFDGNGAYDDSSTVAGTMTYTYAHEAIYTAVFYVRDDDGNETIDSTKVAVKNSAPKITYIRQDTTILIKDSIPFICAATDVDGTIKEYALDFTDDGTFEWVSPLPIMTGFRYLTAGVYKAVLRVKDDDSKATYDTTVVTVLLNVPVVDAGTDTGVFVNSVVHLHGAATKLFGTITKWEWKIGSGNWTTTGGPDTFFIAPSTAQTAACSLAATDNGGNRATDEMKVVVLCKIVSVAAGSKHSLILKTDGTLWACGENSYGQFDAARTSHYTPVQIMSDVQNMTAGGEFSLILKTDGTLWACGDNYFGQLGDGTMTSRAIPVQIMSNVKSMSVSHNHSLVLKTDNTLWACGNNSSGQLGDGTKIAHNTPVQIMSDVQNMDAGGGFSLILKTDGTLWACGGNSHGQLGDSTTTSRATPVQIMSDVKSMAAGTSHSMILKIDNTFLTCGRNDNGQLGNGLISNFLQTTATPVQIMSDVKSIAAGESHSMILKTDNTLWACGRNSEGQLGDGTGKNRAMPIQMMSDVWSVAIGDYHDLIIKTDGTLWACGYNYYGQLGNGWTENTFEPVQIIPPQN